MLYDDDQRHIPVPVFSYMKPTIGPRFLLHIMLSMGEFETELDFILHPTIRDSLRYVNLIGPNNDEESLQEYSNQLLYKFIVEQLVNFPNSVKSIDEWIIVAADFFDSVIIRDEMPITDLPPAHQTALNNSMEDEVVIMWNGIIESFVRASFEEIGPSADIFSLPSIDEMIGCTRMDPLIWDPISNFKKSIRQNDESFQDQKVAITSCVSAIDQYMDHTGQRCFIKSRVIAGFPGSGKSFVLTYIALYARSRGLKVMTTSLMAERAVHIGGIHIHKLFNIPVKQNASVSRVAELSIVSLKRHPEKLQILQMMDILFFDEIGQLSANMLSCLDIILRRVRDNNIFLGGILFICTLDHKQLPPINGKPFLVTPIVLTCFKFIGLKESVRASADSNLQRIQQISRMNPRSYEENPCLITEFKELLSETCTFVDNWNDELITPTTYRLYGRKVPAKKASQEYIDKVCYKLDHHQFIKRQSIDLQMPQQSHQEWQPANETTTESLDYKCKEPRHLLFFVGAIFQFTYNECGKFNQSQIGLLLDLPIQDDIDNFRKIQIMVAPAGSKVITYDPNKDINEYIREGWKIEYVGTSPVRPHAVKMNMRGQRKQYGLKHHVTSTVHACMGDTLDKIVTEISSDSGEYRLWDKAQAVVLLSRTKFGVDIFFVGDKNDTIHALTCLIKTTNQWMDYMENIIEISTVGQGTEPVYDVRTYNHRDCPYRLCDMPLPSCNSGFVYMLVSCKDPYYSYVGETQNISTRLNQHNQGRGAKATTPASLRPYSLFAYVCGFDGRTQMRQNIEYMWKLKRAQSIIEGVNCMKSIARLAVSQC